MADRQEWETDWRLVDAIGGGGQGFTRKVGCIADPSRIGVLKTLKNPRDEKARGRMGAEVGNLDNLSKQGLKVPHVLAHNTDKAADLDTALYFVMEYVPGKTLTEEIRERGPQSLEKAAELTADLCSTLSQAHERGVIHRDLKPDNVIVRSFDPADFVIVDYGLSFNRETTGQADLTAVGEQIRNSFLALPETNPPERRRFKTTGSRPRYRAFRR
jgi:serine/threonine protein kinase